MKIDRRIILQDENFIIYAELFSIADTDIVLVNSEGDLFLQRANGDKIDNSEMLAEARIAVRNFLYPSE